jgi:hypothetical protein
MRSKLTFLIIPLISFSLQLIAQDMMYKSNGSKIPVKVVNRTSQSLSYRLTGARDSNLYYISTSVLDSVIFGNGKKEIYTLQRKTEPLPETFQESGYGPHLIGTDVASIAFYQSLAFSYEYFIWKRNLGIKTLFGFSFSERGYYDDKWYSWSYQKGQFARIGLNYYFFPPGSFRVGTGLFFIATNLQVHVEHYIYNPDPPYESNINKVAEVRKSRNFGLTFFVFYQISKNIAVNAGFDGPIYSPADGNSVFRSEILLNF